MQAGTRPDSAPPEVHLDRALALVVYLRANCSWDAGQTPESLLRHLLEEAHEVADAVATGDPEAVRDELGDLLLNLAFQVVIAEERGHFDRAAVVDALQEKMERRHPHLFGRGEAESWEAVKARERADRPSGLLPGIAAGSDPLQRAHRMQQRVAEVGFDWSEPRGAWEKVREEVEEVGAALGEGDPAALEEELGDLLFSVVNLCRLAGTHAAALLVRSNAKFARRFGRLEELAEASGRQLEGLSLDELDRLWEEVKRVERGGTA
jgi:nucleoside triphosphate diphosphatase